MDSDAEILAMAASASNERRCVISWLMARAADLSGYATDDVGDIVRMLADRLESVPSWPEAHE